MTRTSWLRLPVALAFWLLVGVVSSGSVEAEDDPLRHGHALIIGTWVYQDSRWPRLSDIDLQIEQLEEGLAPHFDDIQVLRNPSFDELDAGLRTFLRVHGNDGMARLFIYYAGHGYTETDLIRDEYRGYITGTDTPFADETEAGNNSARAKAISMEAVRAMVSDIDARQVLFLFDSCFSGTVFGVRSSSGGAQNLTQAEIVKLSELPVREFITAGDENEKVPAHSPIPQLLLNAISGDADSFHVGVVTAQQIAYYLWLKTRNSDDRITPRSGKLPGVFDRGEFVFRVGLPNLRPRLTAPPHPLSTPPASSPLSRGVLNVWSTVPASNGTVPVAFHMDFPQFGLAYRSVARDSFISEWSAATGEEAPDVAFIDNYTQLRPLLENGAVWSDWGHDRFGLNGCG